MKNLINTQLIENYIKENGLSKTKFCKICNISLSTYKRIMTDKNVRINALFRISRVLKIPFYQIFNSDKK